MRPTSTGYFYVTCDKFDLKTEGVINESGEVISYDKSFSPEPMIHDDPSTSEYLLRTIQFECPGVHRKGVKWVHGEKGITITIDKPKLIDEGSVIAVSRLQQQSGTYTKTFQFPDGPFEISEEECSLEHGVLKIILRKCLIRKCGGLASIPEDQTQAAPFMPTSSLPSEAAGSDAHPCVQTPSLGGRTGESFQKVPERCLTLRSTVLTPGGGQEAAAAAAGSPVISVALEPNSNVVEGEEPKNGLSPA